LAAADKLRCTSKDRGIPFADLKSAMFDGHKSLGDAIHTLRPDLRKQQVRAETKKAEAAAKKSSAEAKKSYLKNFNVPLVREEFL
jgi:hypothetical protein